MMNTQNENNGETYEEQSTDNENDKKDKGGRPKVSGMFKERGGDTYELSEFYTTFMESQDPTGRAFALKVFTEVPVYERWKEFKRCLENSWFAGHIQQWLDELEVKMRSDSIQAIAFGCDPKDFTRYKWLAEGRAFGGGNVGRPSTQEAKRKEQMDRAIRGVNPKAYDVVMGGN